MNNIKVVPSKRIKKLWRSEAPDGRSLKQYARELVGLESRPSLTPASGWAKAWLEGKK